MPINFPEQERIIKKIVEEIDACEGDPAKMDAVIEAHQEGIEAVVGGLLESLENDESLVEAIKLRAADLTKRRQALDVSAQTKRLMIQRLMDMAGIATIKLPAATLTIRDVAPKLEILDESEIPTHFFKVPDPVVDKKAVLDAVKAGEAVPGAALGNGGRTLAIRHT